MEFWSRPGSSAVNRLKGRENVIQLSSEKEEEEHVLPPFPHTDKPRAPHFSFRLNRPLWLLLGPDWPWPPPTTLSPALDPFRTHRTSMRPLTSSSFRIGPRSWVRTVRKWRARPASTCDAKGTVRLLVDMRLRHQPHFSFCLYVGIPAH